MTEKQQRFIDCYCGNATKAALQAGYTKTSAGEMGKRLLQNPEVVAAIQARQEAERSDRIATRQERQAFWTRVMYDKAERMVDRLKASELLGKSEGDFLERVEHVGSVPLDIKVEFVDCAATQSV